jgi:uncharacterized protein
MVEPVAFKPRRPCPMCKKPSHVKYHPFCSNRCAQVDLGRWLTGSYAVPVADEDDQPDGGGDEV